MKQIILALTLVCITSATIHAQNVGVGNTAPASKLDVSGDLSLREGTAITVSAGSNTLTLPAAKNSVYRLTGAAGAFSITAISGGNDGMLLMLINTTGQIMTVTNGSIQTNTGADLVATGTAASVTMIYNGSLSKWLVTGGEGFGAVAATAWALTGNSGTTSSNYLGTSDNNPLYIKTNNAQVGYLPSATNGNIILGKNTGTPTGTNELLIGNQTGNNSMTGVQNIGIGPSAMSGPATGGQNIGIGVAPLASTTSGAANIAMGYLTMQSNTTGSFNVALGTQAMYSNTMGTSNISLGFNSLQSNTTGSGNVAISPGALGGLLTGSNNVAVGPNAGAAELGSGSVFIGASAGFAETTGNKLYIANTSTTTPLIYGDFSTAHLTVNDYLATKYFQMTNGAALGSVLVSDATGNGTWTSPAAVLAAFGTGTQNYITKWNNVLGTTIGNSQIYDNGTNVGINNSSPTQKLDVAGTTKTTNLQMTNGATNGYILQSDASGNGTWVSASTLAANNIYTASGTLTGARTVAMSGYTLGFTGGNVGIGTNAPGYNFDYEGTNSAFHMYDFALIGATNRVLSAEILGKLGAGPSLRYSGVGSTYVDMGQNGTGDMYLGDNNNHTIIMLNASGNVGIGTAAPASALQVVGKTTTTNFDMTSGAAAGYILQSDASGNGTWVSPSSVTTATTHTLTNPTNTITSTVNGVTATASAVTAHTATWTQAGGLSDAVNGVTSNITPASGTVANILGYNSTGAPVYTSVASVLSTGTSVSNTSTTNTLSTTVNGVVGTGVNIVNSNVLSLSGTNLTATINGVASNALNISTAANNIYNIDGTLTGARTMTMGANNLTLNSSSGNLIFNPSSTGRVGIGTASPVSQMANTATNIIGNDGNGVNANSLTWAMSGLTGYVGAFYNANNAASSDGLAVKVAGTASTNRILDLSTGAQASAGTTVMVALGNGQVGIGTGSPYSQLANTATNIIGQDAQGTNANSLTWAMSGLTGYVGAFYNGNNAASSDGLAVKVVGTASTNRILDLSTGAQASAGTTVMVALGNGNVGIGTSGPLSTLDVSGTALIRGTNTNTPATPVSAVEFLTGRSNVSGLVAGQTNADIAIQYGGGGYRHFISSRHNATASSNQNAIDFYLNNSTTATGSSAPGTGSVQMMSITATGVGINTTSPASRLHIAGGGTQDLIVGNTGNSQQLLVGTGAGYSTIQSILQGTAYNILALNAAGGNVGIGTNAPVNTLQVEGTLHMDGNPIYLRTGPADHYDLVKWNSGPDRVDIGGFNGVNLGYTSPSAGTVTATLTVAGPNVGIGTTGPNYPLDVETQSGTFGGNFTFYARGCTSNYGCASNTGASTSIYAAGRMVAAEFDAFSDRRIKKDILTQAPEASLDRADKLKVVTYKYIDEMSKGNKTKTGFIAQEVETVLPAAVNANEGFLPSIFEIPVTASVDGHKLIVTTTKAHDLAVGDLIRIYDNTDKAKDVTVSAVSGVNQFAVDGWSGSTDSLFVYGKKVNDFRNVDFDQITAVAIGAIQELNKKIQTLEKKNQMLESQNGSIRSDIDKLKASVETLQQIVGTKAQGNVK